MYTISVLCDIPLCLTPIVLSHPLEDSATLVIRNDPEPSAYPFDDAPTIMFKWVNWDPQNTNDKNDGERIALAFIEWRDLVAAGAKAAADTNGTTFKHWYGTGPLSDIKAVFTNMWDGSNPTTMISDMVLHRKDFSNQEANHPTMAAYTIPGTGRFHVCPYGLKHPQLSEITCDSLDDSCSSKMRSIAMTLLHEMTHYDKIGSDGIDEAIIDYTPGGAYNDFKRDQEEQETNAQNYAWLAGEQYFADKCNKIFPDPAAGVADTGDDEAYDETDDGPTSTTALTSTIDVVPLPASPTPKILGPYPAPPSGGWTDYGVCMKTCQPSYMCVQFLGSDLATWQCPC